MPGIPVINWFTANLYLIKKGDSVTLSWNTSFCEWVKLDGAAVSLSGTMVRSPIATTTYKLTTFGERGAPSKSLTVTVAGLPPPTPPPPEPPTPPPPEIICAPGAVKCVGKDLMVCNATGNGWILKQANSPSCQAEGQLPNFWLDPVGWVIAVIMQAWIAMLDTVLGLFNLFLSNINSTQAELVTKLRKYIHDELDDVQKWAEGLFPNIMGWLGDIINGIGSWWDDTTSSIGSWVNDALNAANDFIRDIPGILGDWWVTTSSDVMEWINNATSGLGDWIKNFPITIGDWWDEISSEIWDAINNVWEDVSGWIGDQWDNLGDWWDDQVVILQRGWDKVTGDIGAWFDDQIEILQRGWDNTFGEIPGLIDNAVSGVRDWVEDWVPEMVAAMFEWAKPIIKPIQDAVNFLGNISNVVMGNYPKDPELIDIQQKERDAKQRLKELMARK